MTLSAQCGVFFFENCPIAQGGFTVWLPVWLDLMRLPSTCIKNSLWAYSLRSRAESRFWDADEMVKSTNTVQNACHQPPVETTGCELFCDFFFFYWYQQCGAGNGIGCCNSVNPNIIRGGHKFTVYLCHSSSQRCCSASRPGCRKV